MKNLFFACIATFSTCIYASHTFFTPRQVTTDPTFELALTDYHIYHADNEKHFQFSLKPFFQQSNSPDRIASYLMPNCKPCAAVRENGTGDINPLWFNTISRVGTMYSSTLCFAPVRLTYGGILTLYAHWKKFWVLINTAAMGATHDLNVTECNITNTGTCPGFTNMCDALRTCSWCAGKNACCKSFTKGGLDDIQVKLGWDIYRHPTDHVALYAVATFPTGIRPKSELLFEPLVGTKHWSVGGGINADYLFYEREHHRCAVLADIKYRYVFKATERRSLDLCANGNWSRYLQVVTQAAPLNSMPGINFFTRDVFVTPRNTIDAWFALHHQFRTRWNFEIGYNLFWRDKEKIELACCDELRSICCDNQVRGPVGIFDLAGVCGTPVSASKATISQGFNQVVSDTVFTPVTLAQFNLNSAAHPTVVTNKIYAAGAWHYDRKSYGALFGLGGSYEFGNSASFNQWALWANLGIDF